MSDRPDRPHRHREIEWLRTHTAELRSYVGEWVVLEAEEIVAHGADAQTVVAEARRRGIKSPYVFYVEPGEAGIAQLGL
jgi:hypothetical protein